jgi:CRP/FNR family cyclic AMP-dependent transcriptional regulator
MAGGTRQRVNAGTPGGASPDDSPFLMSEPSAVSARIAALGQPRRYARDEYVYHQGSRSALLYQVVSGRVRISTARADGIERVLSYADPGAGFGESGAFDGLPMYTSALAVKDSVVTAIPRDATLAAARDDPALMLEIVRRLVRKQRLLNASIVADGLPARARATLLLYHLLEAHGEVHGNQHGSFRLNLSVEELALMAGVTRVTMSRELAHLVTAGLVQREGRAFVVRDVRALVASAENLLP